MSSSRIFEYLKEFPHLLEVRFGLLDHHFCACAFISQLFEGLSLPATNQCVNNTTMKTAQLLTRPPSPEVLAPFPQFPSGGFQGSSGSRSYHTNPALSH